MMIDLDKLRSIAKEDLFPDEGELVLAAIDELVELRREVALHRAGQMVLFPESARAQQNLEAFRAYNRKT